jgi:hypothetical protein
MLIGPSHLWGCVQLAVRRSFVAADGRPLTIRDFLSRAFPRTTTLSLAGLTVYFAFVNTSFKNY